MKSKKFSIQLLKKLEYLEKQQNIVFTNSNYLSYSVDERLIILDIVKNWIDDEIKKQKNFKNLNTFLSNANKKNY